MVADSTQFFEDDDADTLDLLVSSDSAAAADDDDDDGVKTYLRGLVVRFRDDARGPSDETFWDTISKSARELGFCTECTALPVPSRATPAGGSASFPAAFQTDWGQKHIRATSRLLNISEARAVQLTLSALRSLNGGGGGEDDARETHIQSLLGTRDLVRTVRDHHFQQRVARLQVIAECLRIEQDGTSPHNQAAIRMLDDLDKKDHTMDGRSRGLFRRLLTVACAPHAPPSREELLFTVDLRSETPESLPSAQLQYSGGSGFAASDTFLANCIQAARVQTHREREEAMEAILVLLYNRIDQGIHRVDYVLLLLSFQSCNTFFTTESKRLAQLSGLVCAECMSLWLTNSTEADQNGVPLWLAQHPMMVGVVASDAKAVQEIEAVRTLLMQYASQVPGRRALAGDLNDVYAPESIALLAFALLLRLVDMSRPEETIGQTFSFEKYSMECAQLASDECGAFDYLHATMTALVTTHVHDSFSSVKDPPYDWQLSDHETPFLLEGQNEQAEDLSASTIAYTSIGLEVLTSTIVAFQSTIRTGNAICTENVSMLCSLAATVYGNRPVHCERFWSELDLYTSMTHSQESRLTSNQALCYLMDAAYAGAASALNAAFAAPDQPGLEERLLPFLSPLLQLMSSLCSSYDMVESVLKLLPKGFIRTALLCCSPSGQITDMTAFSKNVLYVLESVQRLARVGGSSSCRTMLCSALEEDDTDFVDGPRVLYRIIAKYEDARIVGSALRIMGYFVETSTGQELWIAKAAKYVGPSVLGDKDLSSLLSGQSDRVVHAGLHVLSGFICNMATVAFCPLCEETDILNLLDVVVKGVRAGCMLLASLLSSMSKYTSAAEKSPYLLSHGVLRCLAMFLRQVRPINNIHASLRVRAASQEARDILIQTLATSTPIGQAIAYFAAAPVSLSLAISLEDALRSSQVLQLASDEYAREEMPKDYGLWSSVMHNSREDEPAINIAAVRMYAQSLVSNIHELDIDLQGLQARRLITERNASEPLLAASAALDLLRLWAAYADEIATGQHGVDDGNATSLSQAAASDLWALSPSRLVLCQVVMPPEVADNVSLRKVWPTDRLSLIDLLIRYLQGGVGDKNGDSSYEMLPTLLAADVLSLALVHAKQSGQTLHVPVAETLLRSVAELSGVLLRSIANVASLVSTLGPKRDMSLNEGIQLRYGLASLRLLRICLDFGPRVVVAVLGPKNSAILDQITGIVSVAASSLCNVTSFEQLSLDAVSTSQVRLTSACIDVLLTLWRSSCGLSNTVSTEISAISDAVKIDLVTDLISIITQFTRLLPKDGPNQAPRSVHLASILLAGTSKALDILFVEMSRDSKDKNVASEKTRVMISDMMQTSFPSLSRCFIRIDGALGVARCWLSFQASFQAFKFIGVRDPLPVLSSFPADYGSQIESHGTQDSLCDTVAAMGWLLSLEGMADISEAGDILTSTNAYRLLLSNQLLLVSSWGQFALMYSFCEVPAGNLTNRDDSRARTLLMAQAVLKELTRMVTDMEEAQIAVSEKFLSQKGGSSAYVLVGLLLEMMSKHFLDVRASGRKTPTGPERAALIDMLGQLKSIMEKLLYTTYPVQPSGPLISLAVMTYPPRSDQPSERIQEDTLYTSCALQKRLLAVAILCITTLDQICPSTNIELVSQPSAENQLAVVLLDFVGVVCKVLGLVDVLSKQARRNTPSARLSNLAGELLEMCVALLTQLLSRERGSRIAVIGDNSYYSNAAASMKRFGVIESLVAHVNHASQSALPTQAATNRAEGAQFFSASESDVRTVQSIFTFVRTVAEVGQNSNDVLSLLSSSVLSNMIVDNPLLIAANQHWVWQSYDDGHSSEKASLTMRGYLPIKGSLPAGIPVGEPKTLVAGPFLSGRDDPVHRVWRTALQILQAVIHAYSEPRGVTDGTNRHFLDTAVAFLKTHYPSLVGCLDQCSSLSFENQRGFIPAARVPHAVLTHNALCETSDILSLVSSLCSEIHVHHFQNSCYDIYQGLTQASHTVLEGLSKFLAASGTARETFTALKEHELQESINREQGDFRYGFNESDIHPLLASGIPNARHEAIKHAHYASRCCAYVTAGDYEGLPSMSENALGGTVSTLTLEQDSQRSMNSPFILRMEYAAAECVSHAISVLSETHPASSCFVMFSPDEALRVDTLPLLTTGMLLAVRLETIPRGENRFCRILHVDTVRRQCHVRYVGAPDGQTEEYVSADAIVGIEDMAKRKPVLAYSAAPISAAELDSAAATVGATASLGDVIIAARWCYQCEGQGMDSAARRSIRKVLAESASALLCTDISLHGEIGTASTKSDTKEKELSTRVLAQLLHLYDDSNEAAKWDGKLKTIVSPSVWIAIQEQLASELCVARKDRKEKKTRIAERAAAINITSPWLNSSRRHGGIEPVQGLGFALR